MRAFSQWECLYCAWALLLVACGPTPLAPQPLAVCRFPAESGIPAVAKGRPDVRFVYELGDTTGSRLAPQLAEAFAKMTGTPFLYGAVTASAGVESVFCATPDCPAHVVAVGQLARRLDPYPPQGQVVRTRRLALHERQLWLLQGENPLAQNIAAFRFLHALGVRFYHPRATYYPDRPNLAIPPAVERTESPGYAVRGWHIETRVPTPASRAFLGAGGDSFGRATEIIDWLLANGQSMVQWALPATWSSEQDAHYRALVAHAHGRGMQAGVLLRFGPASAASGLPPERQVEMAAALGVDSLALGTEVLLVGSRDRSEAGKLLSEGLLHAAATTGLRVFWHAAIDAGPVHMAGPEVGVMAEGSYLGDLFQRGNVHELLSNRQLGLLAAAAPRGNAAYFSYVSAWDDYDVNVPVFLPGYWYARWSDLQQLRSLPDFSFHVASDTGWEWAYWTNAAIVFAATWNPQREFERTVEDAFAPMGRNTCGQVTSTLAQLALAQRELVESGLGPYLTGQNYLHEGLARAGIATRPLRPEFGAAITDASRAVTLETIVIPALESFLLKWTALERGLFPAIPRVDEPARIFLQELVDSIVITRLYLEHTIALLRAANAARERDWGHVDEAFRIARDQTSIAGLIVAAREPLYRYPAEEMAGMSPGPEGYLHGYLYSVRNLSLWTREETALENTLVRERYHPRPPGQ